MNLRERLQSLDVNRDGRIDPDDAAELAEQILESTAARWLAVGIFLGALATAALVLLVK